MTKKQESTYNFGGFSVDCMTGGQFVFYDNKNNWLVTIQPEDEYEFYFHLLHFYDDYEEEEMTSFQIYTQLITLRFKRWGQ